MIRRMWSWRMALLLPGLMWFCTGAAFGYDRFEINTQVCLYSNRIEIHATLVRSAMGMLIAEEGREMEDLTTSSGFDAELPRLRQAAANFFQLTAWGHPLATMETNVIPGKEQHIRLHLVYPLPEHGPLRIDAIGLKRLPTDQGYGVSVIVQDMVNNKVLGQKVLTAADSSIEVTLLNTPDEVPIVMAQPTQSSLANEMAPTVAETTPPLQTHTTNRYLLLFVAIGLVVLLGGWRLMVRFRGGQ